MHVGSLLSKLVDGRGKQEDVTNPFGNLVRRDHVVLSFRWAHASCPSKAYKTPPTLFEALFNFSYVETPTFIRPLNNQQHLFVC